MRTCLVSMVLLGALLSPGCRPNKTESSESQPPKAELPHQAELIARFHFIGCTRLAGNTNATNLREICALPATRDFQKYAWHNLALAPYRLFKQHVADNANDEAALIHPLLDDLLAAESFWEVRGETNQTPELNLAVRLDENRAQFWNTNVAAILKAWMGQPIVEVQVDGFKGWQLTKHHAPDLVRLVRAGNWTVIGLGQGKLPSQDMILQRLKGGARVPADDSSSNCWFHAWLDWPKLSAWLDWESPITRPQTGELCLFGDGEYLRTKLKLVYPQPLGWSPEPWQIPTNLIHEPLISFTAAQGLAPWWSGQRQLHSFAIQPPPNQFFVWALASIPFQTFAAVPCPNATNVLARINPKIMEWFSANLPPSMGSLRTGSNHTELAWQNLPFVVPFLKAVQDDGGAFLFAGLFPNAPGQAALPPELFAQLTGRTNQVYYDWEITQERLLQWRNLSQLYLTITEQQSTETNVPSQLWLAAIAPKLGNTVTEISVTAPNELSLVRKSHLGLTGIELVALTQWLESTNFPSWGIHWPPRPNQSLPQPITSSP